MFKILLIIVFVMALLLAYPAYILWHQFGRAPTPEQIAGKAPSSQYFDGAFHNEIETPTQTGDVSASTMIREMIHPSSPNRKPAAPLPSLRNDLSQIAQQPSSIIWFGHSSYLLTLDGMTILADPVFSGHSSPFSFLVKSFSGTDAYAVEDLPPIDVLLISHDHYDHLDYETVLKLKHKVKKIIVPLGVGEHFRAWGYAPENITELNWHESATVANVQFTATPTRHFSGRSLARNQTLWASFVIKSAQKTIYMGGDSGYGPHFKAIGERYGPFDLANLECGQYNENWRNIHMMPEETVQAAQDLKAQILFPVHWGKFVLSMHDWDEPIKRASAAAQKSKQAFMTPKIGQVNYLDKPWQPDLWWNDLALSHASK